MNKKLVIAKQKLAFDVPKDFFILASYEDDELMDLSCEAMQEESLLGNMYIGKVMNIVKNLNAAFIQISDQQKGYYSLENFSTPLFTSKVGKKPLCVGDELVVQVEREAVKTKDVTLSTNLNFQGEYLVLTTENLKTGVSAKLGKDVRTHLKALLEGAKSNEYGVIVRTNAKNASDETILQELKILEQEFFHLKQTAIHKTCFSQLYQPKHGVLKTISDMEFSKISEIVTDDKAIYDEMISYFKGKENYNGDIRFYEDKWQSLAKLYNLERELEHALMERVWLKSGAYLIIQVTEALVVIDVNSGKNVAKKSSQENFLKINQQVYALGQHSSSWMSYPQSGSAPSQLSGDLPIPSFAI